jgi:preprotein translocase subunit SecG
MSLVYVLKGLWMFSAVAIVVLVLLHSPKGDGLGLGGQAQMFTSAKSAETALNRALWLMAILFIAVTTVLSAGWVR